MAWPAELAVIPRATDLFEDPGALERVADLAAWWLRRHLTTPKAVIGSPPVLAPEGAHGTHA